VQRRSQRRGKSLVNASKETGKNATPGHSRKKKTGESPRRPQKLNTDLRQEMGLPTMRCGSKVFRDVNECDNFGEPNQLTHHRPARETHWGGGTQRGKGGEGGIGGAPKNVMNRQIRIGMQRGVTCGLLPRRKGKKRGSRKKGRGYP